MRELVVVVVEGVGWGRLPLLEPSGGRRQVGGNGPILVQSSWALADRQRSCRHRVRVIVITVVVVVGASWGGPQGLPGLQVVAGQCT